MVDDFGPNRKLMINAITSYLKPLMDDVARKERVGKGVLATLLSNTSVELEKEDLPIIPFSLVEEAQYNLLMSYLELESLLRSCEQCEFYFRRYPFSGLPVSQKDHLQNACEMFFDRIAQFKDRLKLIFNRLKIVTGTDDERYGAIVRAYSKCYDWELRQRNSAHHNRRFEYDRIDQLGLINLLQHSDLRVWLPDTKSIYRAEARMWVKRVRTECKNLGLFLDTVAKIILDSTQFLTVECIEAES